MASSTIESSAKYLGNLLVEEVQYLAAVKDKVEALQKELEWMQCFLWDVDVKQHKNALLRKWVYEIKDLALDAEDLIETYILKVKHKRQNKGLLDELKWFSCCMRDAKTLHEVGSNIDGLISKISEMTSRLERYGVKSSYYRYLSDVEMDTKILAEKRRTYAHGEDKAILGREECVKEVVDLLQGGQQKIVLVHGMGGIGKTTLARKVYNNEAIKRQFDGLAWAYISQQLQLEAVCRDILLQLLPVHDKNERNKVKSLSDSQLLEELRDKLKEKKFLVVLDDVWSNKDWERLQHAFPLRGTSHGSKLLITTRNRQILPDHPHDLVRHYELQLLDPENSWQLLQNAADFDKIADSKLVEIGQKMLDHCNGHPLAIIVLGGVLATKNKSMEEWQSVCDNLPSHLQGEDSYIGVYQVLAMSYYELPYHLKPCFLLLGHFPEDYDIPVERLYHIWIAEGIISSTLGKSVTKRLGQSLEEICEVYLNELVHKGMVQVGKRHEIYGTIKSCRLHDLMRDKCLEINKEENFLQIINYHARENDPQRKLNVPDEKLRRMTIYGDDKIPSPIPKSASGNSPPLRSILFFALERTNEYQDIGCIKVALCKDFQLLRVLDFEGLRLTGSLPKEVGSLIFLRYLSLKDSWIKELPSSIENLRSLMILDLRVYISITIPNVVWKMKSLRHLYFPERYRYEIKEGKMLKLEQLSHLEKLENVDLDKVEGLVELGSMRKMTTRCISNKRCLEPILKSKSITWLHLRIHANIVKEDPMVLSTCDSLKALSIDDPMVREMFPQNLMDLGIFYCKLSEDPMPILETLSKLKRLTLFRCDNVNELVCSERGFPELTHLRIYGLSSLKNWTVENGGLPKLREVRIHDSPIRMLPDVLPTNVSITCDPCVRGIERYGTCRYFKGVIQDDEEEDDDGENSVVDDIEDADDITH